MDAFHEANWQNLYLGPQNGGLNIVVPEGQAANPAPFQLPLPTNIQPWNGPTNFAFQENPNYDLDDNWNLYHDIQLRVAAHDALATLMESRLSRLEAENQKLKKNFLSLAQWAKAIAIYLARMNPSQEEAPRAGPGSGSDSSATSPSSATSTASAP